MGIRRLGASWRSILGRSMVCAASLQVVERVVRNANAEKGELQAQLRETIASYTDAIEKLHTQLSNARGGPAARLRVQLHEARGSGGSSVGRVGPIAANFGIVRTGWPEQTPQVHQPLMAGIGWGVAGLAPLAVRIVKYCKVCDKAPYALLLQ